jgi:sugar phosphate isomerase/epimerase
LALASPGQPDIITTRSTPIRPDEFMAKLRGHGLSISALNCSGNPLHPGEIGARHREVARKTIALGTSPSVVESALIAKEP